MSLKELNQLAIFLGAYFIFSDGCSTLSGSATTFARKELRMQLDHVLYAILELSVCAVAGCLTFYYVEKFFNVSRKYILVGVLFAEMMIPVYAMVALTQDWEFFILVFIFG